MALLRVDARPLLPRLRAELTGLLGGLAVGDWARPTACPGWDVHAVAAHLPGVELGNVSRRRDGWGQSPGPGEELDTWLNGFNQQRVDAARRVSPPRATAAAPGTWSGRRRAGNWPASSQSAKWRAGPRRPWTARSGFTSVPRAGRRCPGMAMQGSAPHCQRSRRYWASGPAGSPDASHNALLTGTRPYRRYSGRPLAREMNDVSPALLEVGSQWDRWPRAPPGADKPARLKGRAGLARIDAERSELERQS